MIDPQAGAGTDTDLNRFFFKENRHGGFRHKRSQCKQNTRTDTHGFVQIEVLKAGAVHRDGQHTHAAAETKMGLRGGAVDHSFLVLHPKLQGIPGFTACPDGFSFG